MLEEFKSKIELAVSERLNNPIIYSFVISWALINYKFLMILFSKNTVTVTIQLIETLVWPGWEFFVLKSVVLPILAVLFYVYILPVPTEWVYSHRLKTALNLKNIRSKIEGEQVLTLSESKILKERLLEVEVTKDREIEQLRDEVTKFKDLYKKSLSSSGREALSASPEYADFRRNEVPLDLIDDSRWVYSLGEFSQRQVKKTLRRLCQVREIGSDEYADHQSASFLDFEEVEELVSRGLISRVKLNNSASISITDAGRALYQYLNSKESPTDL